MFFLGEFGANFRSFHWEVTAGVYAYDGEFSLGAGVDVSGLYGVIGVAYVVWLEVAFYGFCI